MSSVLHRFQGSVRYVSPDSILPDSNICHHPQISIIKASFTLGNALENNLRTQGRLLAAFEVRFLQKNLKEVIKSLYFRFIVC